MIRGKKLIIAISDLFILVGLAVPIVAAKSLYVISDTQISEIFAYKIDGSNLTYQTKYFCQLDPIYDDGAVGLAIDKSDYGQFIFATFEYSDVIELVNAKTMQYVNSVTAPGATNLSGIAMDTDSKISFDLTRFSGIII